MYDIDTFSYSGYTLASSLPDVPYIDVDVNTATVQEIQDAVDSYLSSDGQSGRAPAYRDAYLALIGFADYVRDRFYKDLTSAMVVKSGGSITGRLSTIDPISNTFTANYKADNIFAEAMRGCNYSSEGSLAEAGINCQRLFTDVFQLDDGSALVYTENGQSVTYDPRAMEVEFTNTVYTETSDDYAVEGRAYYTYRNGYYVQVELSTGDSLGDPYYERSEDTVTRLFINAIPNATGTSRVFYAYEADGGDYKATFTLRYSEAEERWYIASYDDGAVGHELVVTDDIDADEVIWTVVG